MSQLLDPETWLDGQLAATNPPQPEPAAPEPSPPAQPTFLYEMPPSATPQPETNILYPPFTDFTLPQTPRAPVPTDPAKAQQTGDPRMDAEAWLDNALATTPTPRSVMLPSGLSSYGNDFLKTIDTTKLTPEEYLSINPDVEVVRGMLHNPQYTPTFEEWQDLTAIEKRLVDQGKIKKPGNLEMIANAAGGLVVLASDFIYNTAIDADGSITRPGETIDRMQQGTWRLAPAETLARSPATMMSAGKLALATLQYLGQWIDADWNERPQYVVNETGEFLASSAQLRLPDAETLAKQYAARGQTIRPVTEQETQKFDYDRFVQRRQTQKLEDDALNNTTAPTEFVTMLLTGRNQEEKPIQSQAQVGAMAGDPTAWIPFGSATKSWGLSSFSKKTSAKMLGGLEKVSGGLVRTNDVLFDRFAKTVSDQTGVELSNWQKAGKLAKDVAKGSQIPAVAGATSYALGVDPYASAAIMGAYPIYRSGLGVLRRLETGSRLGKTILRESADATNGLDQAARLSIAANPAVPAPVREALERPASFLPIESTPARIAANPAFDPTTRAVAQRLSNPFVVQAVRNSAALAKGSAKGAIANAPFAYLASNAGDEEAAAAVIGAGLAFGTAGAAFERVGGVRDRRVRQAVSDIGRMLIDVELVGGDVNHLVKTRDMQGLADLAALQGYYRDGFEFIPLNNADYNANRLANGEKDIVHPNKQGTAGYFLQTPPDGGKPRIYINLDATNRNPLPHEIGHLITAGGLDNPQKIAAHAWVDKTYGPDGLQARAEEYAGTLIQARADAAARAEGKEPQPVNITPEQIAAEIESLGQDGLVRGDLDTMDWARDEIFAETFATNAEAMDWASIRRGNPAAGNFLTFAEGILGAQARGLMAAGVRIDPQTGKPLDTPARLFKENPVLAADPQVMKQLETYSKNWRSLLLSSDQSKPRGARIAPSGRSQDITNGGLVKNHRNDAGGLENPWQVIDPNGVIRDKNQQTLNAEQKLRAQQVENIFETKKLTSPANPIVAKKKRTDGKYEIAGTRLPEKFFFSNSFGRHIRDFARAFEEAMEAGQTMLTSYFAVLTRSDTGALRVKDYGNAIRIDREIMPFRWKVSKQNNILAEVLDITKFRNRVNRAIADGDEPIARLFDNKWENIEPAFKKLLDNHRNNLPGESGLGAETRDVLNALIGIGTIENRARNPYSGRYGRDSAVETFRLDRINDTTPSGRTGYHFDYRKAAGNALPQSPTPLPDLSTDLPTPRGQAMPDVADVSTSTSVSALQKHPMFKAAKYDGSAKAAFAIVESLVKPEAIQDVISKIDPNRPAYIVPVIAREGESANMLPLAMADKLSEATGIPIWSKLAKTSSQHNTGAKADARARTMHRWKGEPPPAGSQIVLVDDTYTTGQTLRSLAAVVGDPDAVATISVGRYTKQFTLQPDREQKLLAKAGLTKQQFINLYGSEPKQILTGAQAQQYLLNGARGEQGLLARFPVERGGFSTQGIAGLTQLPEGVTTFSGGGLVEIGLSGIVRPTVAVEYSPAIAQAYRAAHGDHVKVQDIRAVSLEDHKGKFHYHASPVCKNSSLLKSAALGGGEKDLDVQSAQAVARHIDEIEPRVVTIENVPDYRTTQAADIIRKKLQDRGYMIDEAVYNAADYGAPTARRRYLLRAVKGGLLPEPVPQKGPGWYETVADMIEDLPDDDISRAQYIYRSMREQGVDPDNVSEPLLVSGTTLFKKVAFARPNDPAFTFKATPATVDRILLPGGRVKRVTARAKARMTGIPDSYQLPKDEKTALTIIGNGVPPALVRNVFGPVIEANNNALPQSPTPLPDLSTDLPTPKGQAMPDVDENTGLPLNKDGTVTIFHGTTAEKAARIKKEGILRSEAEPDVYFSTAKNGTGYGDGTVIAVQIDPKKLQLDDEFPDGRKDFRVSVGKAKQLPIKIENVFTPGQAMP